MKKHVLLAVLMLLPLMASADAVEIDGLYYNLDFENKTAEVTMSQDGYSGEINIPNQVTYENENYRVSSIGMNSFISCFNLTSLTIPQSVTFIDNRAFNTLFNLVSIVVDAENPVYDSRNNCNAIIETASNQLVVGCKNTIIPNNVTSIGDFAFLQNSSLEAIDIPTSVSKIGNQAFYGCNSLESLFIPSSVMSIGFQAFRGCTKLSSVIVDGNNPKYDSRENCNAIIETATSKLIVGCKNSFIPGSVAIIGDYAFYNCYGIASLAIPNSVISVGEGAFDNTDWYYNTHPDGLVYAGRVAYKYKGTMSANTSIVIDQGTTEISPSAFSGCSGLTSISIPNSVMSIGNNAFRDCKGLLSVVLPSVSMVGTRAFQNCIKMGSVTLSSNTNYISSYAFQGCTGLKDIICNAINVPTTGNNIFDGVPLNANLFVPQANINAYLTANQWNRFSQIAAIESTRRTITVTTAGTLSSLISDEDKYMINELYLDGEINGTDLRFLRDMAGNNYKGEMTNGRLKILDISNVKIVAGGDKYLETNVIKSALGSGYGSFDYSIDVSDEIPTSAFQGCKLETVYLPFSINKLGQQAFCDCINLSSIYIPQNVTSIGMWALNNCMGLQTIRVHSDNPTYDSRDNCNAIIETATNTLIAGCQLTTIPESVTSIGNLAFMGCSGLASVTIPNSVTSIGSYAFAGCSSLTSIVIPQSVSFIGNTVFSGCELKTIKVEEGNAVFDSRNNCNAIIKTESNTLIVGCKYTKIPETVTSIGFEAFTHCRGLTSIMIPNSVTSIEGNAFYSCSDLQSISIPNSVTSIGNDAFTDCRSLSSVKLPANLAVIDNSVFAFCDGLSFIAIPETVTSIGKEAFLYCSSLTNVSCYAVNPPTANTNTFTGTSIENVTLHVPAASVDAYKAAEPWSQFKEIKAIQPLVDSSDPIEIPLTFEAIDGTVTVNIMNYYCSQRPVIQYSIDGGPWTDFTLSNTECYGTIMFSNKLPSGKIVQLRGNEWYGGFWESDHLEINCDDDCYVYGNVCSLDKGEDFAINNEEAGRYGFLFKDNTHIRNHPNKDLILPSTTLTERCYAGMFKGCTGLIRAPKLPATTLADECYTNMFMGCTNLTEAPELPATKLEKWCYVGMFFECPNLKYVKCLATENIVEGDGTGLSSAKGYFWPSDDDNGTVTSWLKDAGTNVSGTKTFIVNESLTITGDDPLTATVENWGERSISGIPEGWRVSTKLGETSTVSIGKSGKASYCGDKSLDFSFSDEIKAYIATGFDKDEGTIWLTRVKDVPAGVPVLIKGDANKTYDVPVTDSENSYYTNMFVGNTTGETVQVGETDGDKVNYYLSGDGTFKSVNKSVNIGNNKSYLQLPGTFESAVEGATQMVTIKDIGKASYAAPVDLDFTNVEGLKAFTATGYDKSTKTIWLTRVMKVQKGEGVLLKGDAKDYEIPSAAVQSSYMNMFVGNISGDKIQVNEKSDDGSQTNFYLNSNGAFVSVNGFVNIGSNKCYLELPTSMVSVASTRGTEKSYKFEEPEMIKMPIIFRSLSNDGDGTTGIKVQSPMSNVQSDAYYTLQGQRVAKPGKGLYIRNGKKVVIK